MKELFGTDLKKYNSRELSSINTAVRYEITLYSLYAVWNFTWMLAGVIFVYINTSWFTTNEMLGYLAIFWGVSGLPFFVVRDKVKRKFASALPGNDAAPPAMGLTLLKILAGLAIGSWATHVMLIATLAKTFDLRGYSKKLAAA